MCKLTEVQQRYIDDLKAAHAAGFCVMYRASEQCCWVQCRMPVWSNHPSCYRMDQLDQLKWEKYKRDRDCCTEQKPKPHPHADLIKAWADGAAIQCRMSKDDPFDDTDNPHWLGHWEYRIKPEQTDLEKYGVEVGDVWDTHRDQIITVRDRIPLPCGVTTLSTRSYIDNKHLKTLLFRRGVVNKL